MSEKSFGKNWGVILAIVSTTRFLNAFFFPQDSTWICPNDFKTDTLPTVLTVSWGLNEMSVIGFDKNGTDAIQQIPL